MIVNKYYALAGKWPILTGAGFGLGMAYSNCEKDINATIAPQKKSSSAK